MSELSTDESWWQDVNPEQSADQFEHLETSGVGSSHGAYVGPRVKRARLSNHRNTIPIKAKADGETIGKEASSINVEECDLQKDADKSMTVMDFLAFSRRVSSPKTPPNRKAVASSRTRTGVSPASTKKLSNQRFVKEVQDAATKPLAIMMVHLSSTVGNSNCEWHFKRLLGKGPFSQVWLGVSRQNGIQHAVKIVDKHNSLQFAKKRQSTLSFDSEAKLLANLDHPSIVRLFDWFETNEEIRLVLEYVPGPDLYKRLKAGRLEETQGSRIFRQLCEVVKYLHEKSIVHRDLKPENVLLTEPDCSRACVKLADFGLSRLATRSQECLTFCGTLVYTAPEVIKTLKFLSTSQMHSAGYGHQADLWSLGVVLYVMLSGVFPFDENKAIEILQGRYAFVGRPWRSVSNEAKDLVRALMTVEPNERLDITGALRHSWLQ